MNVCELSVHDAAGLRAIVVANGCSLKRLPGPESPDGILTTAGRNRGKCTRRNVRKRLPRRYIPAEVDVNVDMSGGQMRLQPKPSADCSIDADDRVSQIAGTRLTKREKEIVAALMRGCANKDIARELGVSDQTVKNQLTTLFRKLGVGGRLELVAIAWRGRRQ